MYIQGDSLILLRDDGDYFLAYCEGEVGWVKRQNVSLGGLASSSAPTSPTIKSSPSKHGQYDDYSQDEDCDDGGDTPVMQSATWAVMGDSSGAEDAPEHRPVVTASQHDAQRRSSPTSSQSSHTFHQHQGAPPPRPSRRPVTVADSDSPPVHSRTDSDTSTSTRSSSSTTSEPIGTLVLGGFSKPRNLREGSEECG